MTPLQIERIQNKIVAFKKALADDKKFWKGYYHDGRGYRYEPQRLYIQIQDFKGALRYFNWFDKNFDDDIAYAEFFFEWSLTCFKNKKYEDAEKKALQLFMSNTYMIDTFLERPIHSFNEFKDSEWHLKQVQGFKYLKHQDYLKDYALWLEKFVDHENFKKIAGEYLSIELELENTSVGKQRSELVNKQSALWKLGKTKVN